MKEKLKIFLEFKNLTAAQMADQIGVQRSSFSHILNGRNKPSAYFISKMLHHFPEINANWLFGMSENMLLTQRLKNSNLYPESKEVKNEKDQIKEIHGSNNDNKRDNKNVSLQDDTIEKTDSQAKRVKKIVYFYTDFTFTEYYPG